MQRHRSLSPDLRRAVAARFRLLGAESRLAILDALMPGALTTTELQERTGLTQSNLSRRLTELESGGCVRRRREGREIVVEIADPALEALCRTVCGALEAQADRQRALVRGR